MNLMKLFNFNYFKENLKKSKNLLAFFFGLVPLLNVIMLILIIINNNNPVLMEFSNLSIITYLGMYIIPIVLACSLIGFVFKRKSVDFVLSKPINRASIFITSLIGGISLILIYMLLNSFIFLIFNLVGNILIPFPLIIDYFLYYLIGYIFMFTISLLAISLSGNFISSIVIILITICLVPFIVISNEFLSENNSYSYIKGSFINASNFICKTNTCKEHLKNNEYEIDLNKNLTYNFTAPLMFLKDGSITYNSKSIIKMTMLIILYSVLGYYLFNKRKMENNETSFKNEKLHYLVKIITLLPVSFIAYVIMTNIDFPTNFIICLVAIIIYQTVYDLITRKEIYKLKKSLLIIFVSCIIFMGFYSIYNNTNKTNIINLDDLTSFKVYTYSNYYDSYYGNKKYYEIKDPELIHNIINDTLNNSPRTNQALITINNKEYRLNIADNEYRDQINLAYKNDLIKDFSQTKINKIIYVSDLKLTKELKNILSETLNQSNLEPALDHNELLTIYKYQNHQYKSFVLPSNLNQKLDQYVLKAKNEKFIKLLEDSSDIILYAYNSNNLFSDLDLYVFDYVLITCKNEFINYLTQENNTITANNFSIGFNNLTESYYFPIGDADKFKEEFKKYQTKLSKTKEYQELINSYNEVNYK